MKITCARCSEEYDIDDKFGGRWGHCENCDRYVMLPIPDTEQLFAWLQSSPLKDVNEFIQNYGLRGHAPRTVKKALKIFEHRRWDEEYPIEREQPAREKSQTPSPETEKLLSWLRSAPWDEVEDFISNSELRGQAPHTVKKAVQIFEHRRWDEENRVRREQPASDNSRLLSLRERKWRRVERRQWRQNTLKGLREISPAEFEERIADVFEAQGYQAKTVGGVRDDGIDVEVENSDGQLLAVVQCKRYSEDNRISSKDIRAFAGAFLLTGAEKGFYVTTGKLTRYARLTAARYLWLKVYSGEATAAYIEKHLGRIKVGGNAPVDAQGVELGEATHNAKPDR